jgi:hypothetical protein
LPATNAEINDILKQPAVNDTLAKQGLQARGRHSRAGSPK